jgi:hypothetical protein
LLVAAPATAYQRPGKSITFDSHGSLLSGLHFRADEAGARPTVILL